ncbi:hypothetical protein METBIDRAFT_12164 [Metschnikowia bicuspidata var. bicuspidata NRRL YB-4993]|uniref:SAP domain-containing protein n=1 Tax=Metschnikowia bicuspidata var. bicuspidata NRRL YB-4993 TaxID=869754 RepID=A0A1A0HC21_9ASCO|nr:hypothetical protein METBIDRAFT_12164 [Metschnikowia bicuspidata var. bicuspidata NRRL YB-4993]OBA21684.1 hypothetical protein METBIDRAFT_12164 [Metschnikowia bicuspidata var. bicuspidata NRRL YB-4993]
MSTAPLPAAPAAEELRLLQQKIGQFRVVQLKELCKHSGLAVSGRKQDLVDRVLQLVRQLAAPGRHVEMLAMQTLVWKLAVNGDAPPLHQLVHTIQLGHFSYQQVHELLAQFRRSAGAAHPRDPARAVPPNPLAPGTAPPDHSAWGTAPPNHTAHAPPGPAAPAARYRSTVFYTLRQRVGGHVLQASKARASSQFVLALSASQAALLRMDARARLLLLCCAEPAARAGSAAPILFPPIEIHVDNVLTKQSVRGLKGRPGSARPADLTPYVAHPERPVAVRIVYSDAPERHLLDAYIAETALPEAILDAVRRRPHVLLESTRRAVCAENERAARDGVVVASVPLSLRCPITYARIATPVKSVHCDHVQCFDGLSFLMMQERIPAWQCPVCSLRIDEHLLAVSDFLQAVLDGAPPDADAVRLQPDGSWRPDDAGPRPQAPAPADASVEVISLDSDSDPEPDVCTVADATLEPADATLEPADTTLEPADTHAGQDIHATPASSDDELVVARNSRKRARVPDADSPLLEPAGPPRPPASPPGRGPTASPGTPPTPAVLPSHARAGLVAGPSATARSLDDLPISQYLSRRRSQMNEAKPTSAQGASGGNGTRLPRAPSLTGHVPSASGHAPSSLTHSPSLGAPLPRTASLPAQRPAAAHHDTAAPAAAEPSPHTAEARARQVPGTILPEQRAQNSAAHTPVTRTADASGVAEVASQKAAAVVRPAAASMPAAAPMPAGLRPAASLPSSRPELANTDLRSKDGGRSHTTGPTSALIGPTSALIGPTPALAQAIGQSQAVAHDYTELHNPGPPIRPQATISHSSPPGIPKEDQLRSLYPTQPASTLQGLYQGLLIPLVWQNKENHSKGLGRLASPTKYPLSLTQPPMSSAGAMGSMQGSVPKESTKARALKSGTARALLRPEIPDDVSIIDVIQDIVSRSCSPRLSKASDTDALQQTSTQTAQPSASSQHSTPHATDPLMSGGGSQNQHRTSLQTETGTQTQESQAPAGSALVTTDRSIMPTSSTSGPKSLAPQIMAANVITQRDSPPHDATDSLREKNSSVSYANSSASVGHLGPTPGTFTADVHPFSQSRPSYDKTVGGYPISHYFLGQIARPNLSDHQARHLKAASSPALPYSRGANSWSEPSPTTTMSSQVNETPNNSHPLNKSAYHQAQPHLKSDINPTRALNPTYQQNVRMSSNMIHAYQRSLSESVLPVGVPGRLTQPLLVLTEDVQSKPTQRTEGGISVLPATRSYSHGNQSPIGLLLSSKPVHRETQNVGIATQLLQQAASAGTPISSTVNSRPPLVQSKSTLTEQPKPSRIEYSREKLGTTEPYTHNVEKVRTENSHQPENLSKNSGETRYSKTVFDHLSTNNTAVPIVRGILGIELSKGAFQPSRERTPTFLGTPSKPGSTLGVGNPPVQSMSAQQDPNSHADEQEESHNTTFSPLNNSIKDMVIQTPTNKKRSISEDFVTEKTWNKRLSKKGTTKKKFVPSDIDLAEIIELND